MKCVFKLQLKSALKKVPQPAMHPVHDVSTVSSAGSVGGLQPVNGGLSMNSYENVSAR
jgi:hypothetical protein